MKNPSKDYFEIKPIPEIDLFNVNAPLLSKIFIIELKNSDDAIHYTISRDKLYSLGDSIKANGEKAEFNNDLIQFNGVDGYDHEPFIFTRKYIKDEWMFCKTARKPYDLIVQISLILLSHYFNIEITTDGLKRDWEQAIELTQGYKLNIVY